MIASMTDIEQRLIAIEERNKRVETDKAWETSFQRRACIVGLTYALIVLLFYTLGNEHPLRNATVPTLGYFLSTLSLEWAKRAWVGLQLPTSF